MSTLNIDCGEGLPYPEDLFICADLLNIGCGEHAGSWDETLRFIEECRVHDVRWGAHPGYPDRDGFGRSPWDAAAQFDWQEILVQQSVRMAAEGAEYVKPHGAFYNESARGLSGPTEALIATLKAVTLPLLGLPGSEHERIAAECGVPFWSEGFADRGYGNDGHLLPRGVEGSLIKEPDAAAAAARKLSTWVDSVCLHSDMPGWEERMRAVRAALNS
ncbi:MAG: LamB/YcsF family protein [Fimbriimonadaceae bacterium]|nr:LamB/YcsF family protein [Fimbriimonadaceae bacterium]